MSLSFLARRRNLYPAHLALFLGVSLVFVRGKGGHPGGDSRGTYQRVHGLPRSRPGGGGRGATVRGGAERQADRYAGVCSCRLVVYSGTPTESGKVRLLRASKKRPRQSFCSPSRRTQASPFPFQLLPFRSILAPLTLRPTDVFFRSCPTTHVMRCAGFAQHVLYLSATPIPRSLTLALHGDMEVGWGGEEPWPGPLMQLIRV